ncbi:MAG: efflux RND transporter periplasmic adaptor subunit [Verrucomicrobia bacterium]|nr:efflux RND transporter periplasmic adaptor subunit [Verrucomicrobiota bacterium]
MPPLPAPALRPTNPSRPAKLALLPFASAALLLMLAGCGEKAAAPAAASGSKRGNTGPVPVVVDTAKQKDMPLNLLAIGAVESVRAVAIKSLVTGVLQKVNFREGQDVKAGELLFEIDPRPFQNALRSAEADLQKIRVQLETAQAQVKRYQGLEAEAMVSKEQFRTIQDSARVLQAQLLTSESNLANAKLQLDYCSIRAPFDGRTGGLGAHEGDLVRASDATVSLVTVTQLAPIYVTFAIPQQELASLQRYKGAGSIGVAATVGGTVPSSETGELIFIDSAIDTTTGTIKAKASFSNAGHVLWPGQFVNLKITLTTLADQIVVPTKAIQYGQEGQQVFVVSADKKAELRRVTVGNNVGLETTIAKGLKVGETVVVDGQIRLRPGAEVDIKPPVDDVPTVRGSGKKKGGGEKSKEGGGGTGGEKAPKAEPAGHTADR